LLFLMTGGPANAQTADAAAAPATVVHFEPTRGLSVETADGSSAMRIWSRFQTRLTVDAPRDEGDRTQTSAEIRRASLFIDGHLLSASNYFFMQAIFTPRELSGECVAPGATGACSVPVTHTPLFDAFMSFNQVRDASVRVGLFKPFYSRQFIAPWGGLAFVDRSLVDGELRIERDIGIDIFSQNLFGLGQLRYHAGLFGGHGRDNFRPQGASPLLTGRLEWMPTGVFANDPEGDLREDTSHLMLAFGIAGAHQFSALRDAGTSGTAPLDGGTTDLSWGTADAVVRYGGVSAEGAYYVRTSERHAPAGGADPAVGLAPGRDSAGWYAQVTAPTGLRNTQIGARTGTLNALSNSAVNDRREAGGVLSHYFIGQDLKLQADYFHYWFPDSETKPVDEVRLQLQVTL
jgi:hypothetical protein